MEAHVLEARMSIRDPAGGAGEEPAELGGIGRLENNLISVGCGRCR
ncbi:MAG: hypothetical protein GX471_20465 [Candidatus Microthrix parvicella]|nr:hypothetical protein [Candidatus Microthrix parvicella]